MTEDYKYWAFISYSHQDRAWGDWLHKTLETYRVPRRLIGRPSRDGQVPARLYPIFRDRDELPSSANLGDVLNESLRQSRYQIVICSPRSAASKWVNEEIKYFKSLGREDRVLCLIVDGEPNVFDIPGRDIEECFAPALRYRVDAHGQITDTPAEPIAADAREHADGKRGAKLKLLSGLLGVGLDELVQRERQREFWKRVQAGAAAMAFAGLCLGAWQWFQNERAAREREIVIEKLVENGRLELLAGQHARAAVYLNEAYKMGHDTVPLRFMLAQAMKPVEALSTVRVEHGGFAVYQSAFSPDDRLFALHVLLQGSGMQRAVVKIYDASSGTQLAELEDAPALPLQMAFLGGGERLLMTGFPDDDRIGAPFTRIWELATARAVLRIDGINGLAGSAAHPDGSRILIADRQGLHILDAETGGSIAHWLPGQALRAASYSSDGTMIAVANSDGIVFILSAQDGRVLRRFAEAEGQNLAALVFPSNRRDLVALSGRDGLSLLGGDIRLWDLERGVLRLAFSVDREWLTSLRFMNQGQRFLTVGSEGYKVWSAARGVMPLSVPRGLTQYASAALSPDGGTLITADFQGKRAEAWDVASGALMFTLDLHTDGVSSAAFSADGRRLLLSSRDGSAELWRMPVTERWRYESFDTLPYVARFSRDGRRVLAGGGSAAGGRLLNLDAASGTVIDRLDQHGDTVFDLNLSPDLRRFVTASADGTVGIWDDASRERIATLPHGEAGASAAVYNRAGDRVLTTTVPSGVLEQDSAVLWDAFTGRKIAALEHRGLVASARFDSDGQRILTAGWDGAIKLWRAADGGLIWALTAQNAKIMSGTFSPDGRLLLSAAYDGTVRIVDSQTRAEVASLRNAGLGIPDATTFAPDGRQVAIGMQSGEIRLWDPSNGATLTLKGHRQLVDSLAYTTDGLLLFSGAMDGEIRAWDARSGSALGVLASFDRRAGFALHEESGALAATAWSRIVLVDIRPEARTAETVARVLACQAPWTLDPDLFLVPTARRIGSCPVATPD